MSQIKTTKTIIITGASDGIGKALAKEMAQRGYDLGLCARRTGKLEALKSEILSEHPETRIMLEALDVTQFDQVENCLRSLHERLGRTDILLVNAGIARSGKAGSIPFEDELATINTNLNGAIATISAGLKLCREQSFGHIVATSSVAGFRGLPRNAAYSASKAGLSTYMEAVKVETLKENIDISVINPGFIDTEINRSLANRPFVIHVEKGARLFADLIEKKVSVSALPRMPWSVVGPLMKILPDSVIAKM